VIFLEVTPSFSDYQPLTPPKAAFELMLLLFFEPRFADTVDCRHAFQSSLISARILLIQDFHS